MTTGQLLIVVGVLGALSTAGVWIVVREPDRVIARILVLGFVAKVAGTLFRYVVLEDVYEGVGDARRYLSVGSDLAATIRSGTMPPEATETGTPFMEFLSGLLYAVVPTNLLLGFAVFSLLALIGAYLFLQAFRMAAPDADHRRYAALIMLLPTMVFWPSSLGKEAWLILTLGVATYGGARVLRRRRGGYTLLVIASAGVYMVRPHMAALLALSFAAAYLVRLRDPTVRRNVFVWLLGLIVIGVGTAYVVSTFAERVPRDRDTEGSAVEQVFAETQERTSSGGSEFESTPVTSPADLIDAFITVPFRPFPHEAHNAQARIASLEGLVLLGLLLVSLPRLRRLFGDLTRRPFLVLSFAYVVGFVVAFSNVANFGLLARQRAQLVPFLLVLLCRPRPPKTHAEDRTPRGTRFVGYHPRASMTTNGGPDHAGHDAPSVGRRYADFELPGSASDRPEPPHRPDP